jgi:hypothetical protein
LLLFLDSIPVVFSFLLGFRGVAGKQAQSRVIRSSKTRSRKSEEIRDERKRERERSLWRKAYLVEDPSEEAKSPLFCSVLLCFALFCSVPSYSTTYIYIYIYTFIYLFIYLFILLYTVKKTVVRYFL